MMMVKPDVMTLPPKSLANYGRAASFEARKGRRNTSNHCMIFP
jgi:hypothetical protein